MTDDPGHRLIDRAERVLMRTYGRVPVTFVRGRGVELFDAAGKAYLDCLGGLAVVAVGHGNKRVTQAVAAQMETLVHTSNLFYTEPQVALAEALLARSGMERVFFANCGATANEAAIKLARRHGQRRRGADCFHIVSLERSFHGRTMATLAATGQPDKQAAFEPLPSGFSQVPGGDLEALARALDDRVAAVLLETVQGEGGVVPWSAEYLRGVRALCDRSGALMIVDDVQAGIGRTGRWFSWQGHGFEPDAATLAKALANGLPIGACLTRGAAAEAFSPGDHATTFGGGPVVCAAALAVIEEIESADLLANATARSAQLREALTALDGVVTVRGRGLLLACQLERDDAAAVVGRALELGLVLNAVRPDAVRWAPPLCISEQEVTRAVATFATALAA
ncbi:MAG: acetylornithine transaminase [Pseudomonadota bacterium]